MLLFSLQWPLLFPPRNPNIKLPVWIRSCNIRWQILICNNNIFFITNVNLKIFYNLVNISFDSLLFSTFKMSIYVVGTISQQSWNREERSQDTPLVQVFTVCTCTSYPKGFISPRYMFRCISASTYITSSDCLSFLSSFIRQDKQNTQRGTRLLTFYKTTR